MSSIAIGLVVTHESVNIPNPFTGTEIPIDKGLAVIIRLLWALDIETAFCCQDHSGSGRGHIMFKNSNEYEKLVHVMFKHLTRMEFDSFVNSENFEHENFVQRAPDIVDFNIAPTLRFNQDGLSLLHKVLKVAKDNKISVIKSKSK